METPSSHPITTKTRGGKCYRSNTEMCKNKNPNPLLPFCHQSLLSNMPVEGQVLYVNTCMQQNYRPVGLESHLNMMQQFLKSKSAIACTTCHTVHIIYCRPILIRISQTAHQNIRRNIQAANLRFLLPHLFGIKSIQS